MKKCSFCGADMEEELTVCPACGKEQPAPEPETAPEEVTAEPAAEISQGPAPEASAEALSGTETPTDEPSEEKAAGPEKEAAPMKQGVTSASAIALAVAVILLLAVILCVLILNGRNKDKAEILPTESSIASEEVTEETTEAVETTEATIPADGDPDNVTCKGTYTVSDDEIQAARGDVVATAGDRTLTNGLLQILYWRSVQNFYAQYGSYAQYFGLDHTQSMDTQVCTVSEGLTWQQYFLEDALNNWKVYDAVAQQARENGFQMTADSQQQLDELEDGLAQTAADNGFEDTAAMIVRNFGPGAAVDDYKSFWELYFLGNDYYSEVTGSYAPTAEEVAEFFNAHEAEYAEKGLDKTTSTVDVRHILILPEGATVENVTTEEFSEEAWAAGEQKAQEILDAWLSGDKTEDSFAALANENSADTGSNTNGGLYTGVTEGQMAEAFNDWCFDANRKVGDYGIVKTQFGYHIMYFCGSQPLWESQAKSDMISQMASDFLNEAVAAADAKIDYSAIKLGFVDMA